MLWQPQQTNTDSQSELHPHENTQSRAKPASLNLVQNHLRTQAKSSSKSSEHPLTETLHSSPGHEFFLIAKSNKANSFNFKCVPDDLWLKDINNCVSTWGDFGQHLKPSTPVLPLVLQEALCREGLAHFHPYSSPLALPATCPWLTQHWGEGCLLLEAWFGVGACMNGVSG